MTSIFTNVLTWIVGFLLFVPTQLLKLVGNLLPSCSTLGIVSISGTITTAMGNWIRFLWPVIQYIPWSFVWNYFSAVLLYFTFRWLWKFLPKLLGLGMWFWIVVVVFYVLAGAISFFTGTSWQDSSAFTEVFGTSSTVNGATGGGFGGGGGGSW